MIFEVIFFGVFVVNGVFSANILFVTVLPSPSHHIWNEALVEALLNRGHNITLLGYQDAKIKSTNYTVIKLNELDKMINDTELMNYIIGERSLFIELTGMWDLTVLFATQNLHSHQLKRLMDYPKDFFELIVFDMTLAQYLYPLIDYFDNVPAIGTCPFGIIPYISDTFGQHFYSYIPDYYLPYTDEMTFAQRVENTIVSTMDYYVKSYYMAILYGLTVDRFGKDTAPLRSYEQRISLLLANYHPLLDYPQSLPPQIIPVGGLSARPPKKLPEDIQKILDDAKNGVIFFALGTNVNPEWLPMETKKIFLDTFSKLKETVLWKYNGDDLTEVPKNVILRKWFPQNDVLAHQNIKLFISHKGLLSTHEAIYHGVPVVGVPFFLDQINNAIKMESKLLGKKVNFRNVTGDIFYETINEVLQNPMYKANVQKLSRQFRDKPQTPQENAVFWVEYVLRHKDVKNLSSKGRYMSFFHRENLDVIGFLFVILLVVIYFVFFIGKWIVRKTICKKNVKVKQH